MSNFDNLPVSTGLKYRHLSTAHLIFFHLDFETTYHAKWVDGYNFKTVPVYGRCNKLTVPLLGVFPFNHGMGKMHPNYKLLLTYKVDNT